MLSTKTVILQSARVPWFPSTWRSFPVSQNVEYPSEEELNEVLEELKAKPSIVHPAEIDLLSDELVQCATGNKIYLQVGDCAERFADCHPDIVASKMNLINTMSALITQITGRPVVKIGRIAGQYGKPRTSPFEIVNGEKVYAFKGDNVNGIKVEERTPNPKRLLEGYQNSFNTMDMIRNALSQNALNTHAFVEEREKTKRRNSNIYLRIKEALSNQDQMNNEESESMKNSSVFISHEGLLLNYEEAMTRQPNSINKYSDFPSPNDPHYNLSAHMIWIGERTRNPEEAHVEYFRGIKNTIGVKVGPMEDYSPIVAVLNKLNPENKEGKVVLITRMGYKNASLCLSKLLQTITENNLKVAWVCDPMHGNGYATEDKIKTRNCAAIYEEMMSVMRILKEKGQVIAGIHLEATFEHVTECIGGVSATKKEELLCNYTTYCDPRLNFEQSMECAIKFAEEYKTLYSSH